MTAIETSVAALTVNVTAGEVTPLNAAVIDALPTPVAVANPREPLVLAIVATVEPEELQVAVLLRSCFDRSL